jgi:hypothetical protein
MARVLKLRASGDPGSGGGFFARLHAWLNAFQRSAFQKSSGVAGGPHVAVPAAGTASPALRGQVLAFPVHGEALLVTLAGLLRSRIAAQNPRDDLFQVALSREPSPHLRLDQAAYIEFEPGRAVYRLVVALGPATTLAIETDDFDQIVAFVVEYVNDRLAESAAAGGAS